MEALWRGKWIEKWIIDCGSGRVWGAAVRGAACRCFLADPAGVPLWVFVAINAEHFDLALRALGGVWSAYGALWGLAAVLWAGAEECGRWAAVEVLSPCCLLSDL